MRIARTCERMGIATVAVHSEIEADSLHVQTCDEAVCVGGNRVAESYLNGDAIVAAAKATGAQAVHPGYGLLSESAGFARKVVDAGLTFIGPTPDTLELFGDKVRSLELAVQAGVRVLRGSGAPMADMAAAHAAAEELGFPLLAKAVAGGGGIGMQAIDDEQGLEQALRTCAERAASAFGDDRVYLERRHDRPRHVEVQILADGHGQVTALGERECSVQRRHQKVIEESPAPALVGRPDEELKRGALCDAAERVAREAGFVGAGTAEFLMDIEGGLHFMEFNPRLQVEHGVTEMCTGLDLVELQLQIAAGAQLPSEVGHRQPSGHAMEARIYAEDPARDFLPAPGEVASVRFPTVGPGRLRVESALSAGCTVTPFYDPLVAKVIAYGPTRHQALLTLDRVLAETVIAPLTTNLAFLRDVLAHESFRAGQYDTEFVHRLMDELAQKKSDSQRPRDQR